MTLAIKLAPSPTLNAATLLSAAVQLAPTRRTESVTGSFFIDLGLLAKSSATSFDRYGLMLGKNDLFRSFLANGSGLFVSAAFTTEWIAN